MRKILKLHSDITHDYLVAYAKKEGGSGGRLALDLQKIKGRARLPPRPTEAFQKKSQDASTASHDSGWHLRLESTSVTLL